MMIQRNIFIAAGASLLITGATAFGGVFDAGGDRLAALQNNDGGWDYPLNDGNPNAGSQPNTIGPIGKGLAEAFQHTVSGSQGSALTDAGNYLLSKTNTFSPSDGYLAVALDQATGTTLYSNYVKANYYDKLAAGTYQRAGDATFYSTATYVQRIRDVRQNNLSTWDLGVGLYAANAIGASTSEWTSATEAELNESVSGADYDVLGLAGGILGLSSVGASFDPTAGAFASDASVSDLAARLVSHQLSTGGWTYNMTTHVANSDETVQETAYAILALSQFDAASYQTNTTDGADYLTSVQLGTGGWANYVGDTESNEITGEAMWAISAAVPEPTGLGLLGIGAAMLLGRRARRK